MKENRWIIATFLLVASLGFPVWLLTTHVYRAPLILAQNEAMQTSALKVQKSSLLLELCKNSSFKFPKMPIHVKWKTDEKVSISASSLPDPWKWTLAETDAYVLQAAISGNWSLNWDADTADFVLTANPGPKSHEKMSAILSTLLDGLLSAAQASGDSAVAAVPLNPRYHIAITLAQAPSNNIAFRWETKELEVLIDEYLRPFVDSLFPMAEFRITTQIKYGIQMGLQPEKNADHSEFLVKQSHWAELLPQTEWTSSAGSQVDESQIQLVLYMPSEQHHPLILTHDDGSKSKEQSFIVSQWGGVVMGRPSLYDEFNIPPRKWIQSADLPAYARVPANHTDSDGEEKEGKMNRPYASAKYSVLQSDYLREVFSVWLTQLHTLLEIDSVSIVPGGKLYQKLKKNHGLDISKRSTAIVSKLERDLLLWSRLKRMRQSTLTTLLSLERMVKKMSNMAVSDEIRSLFETSIAYDRQTLHYLEKPVSPSNDNLHKAYQSAQQASIYANRAFFAPSMLALLYFPDEHLLAVYAPLFVPVVVPVLMSIIRMKVVKGAAKPKTD